MNKMTTQTWTPDTSRVGLAYVRHMGRAFVASTGEHEAEFDRWLAEHDAQVWEQGMTAGHECVGAECNDRCTVQNPYRASGVAEIER